MHMETHYRKFAARENGVAQGFNTPTRKIEQELWAQGFETVVGIDEVGRGAWAGPDARPWLRRCSCPWR